MFSYDTTVAVAPGTATTLEIVAHDWPQNRASWYWPPAEGERREAEIARKSHKGRPERAVAKLPAERSNPSASA